MRVTVFNEDIERNGNQITVTLEASLCKNDHREVLSFKRILTASGRAKCSPDDKFDEKLGEQIARSRAYKDLFEQVHEVYRNSINDLRNRLKISRDCMDKYLRAIESQKKDIDRLINGVQTKESQQSKKSNPTVVRILPGSNAQKYYSLGIQKLLRTAGISCEIISGGSLFSRINKSDEENIPFTLIINEYEENNGVVSVRTLGGFEGVPSMPVELFIETYIKK